jgi:hypothetical protein
LDRAVLRHGSQHQSAGAARHRGHHRRVVGNKLLSASVREDIIERTDGIALFVDEMTKAVLEAQAGEASRIAAAVPSSGRAVPATLHASLMARLDRLGAAKEPIPCFQQAEQDRILKFGRTLHRRAQ